MSVTAAPTTTTMSEAAKEARREYFRAYRQKNREKLRKYNKEYGKKYRAAHPELRKATNAAYWERKADKDMQKLRDSIAAEQEAPEQIGE